MKYAMVLLLLIMIAFILLFFQQYSSEINRTIANYSLINKVGAGVIDVIDLSSDVSSTTEDGSTSTPDLISTSTDQTSTSTPEGISTSTDQTSTTTLDQVSTSTNQSPTTTEATPTPEIISTTTPNKINSSLVISSISSPILKGTFHSGVIPIVVVFNKEIVVSGDPKLILVTGEPATTMVSLKYHFGNRLYFLYKIISGNSANPLDYNSSSALDLNGGRITDTSGNDADLTLPTPGSAGSLSGRSQIVIDTQN